MYKGIEDFNIGDTVVFNQSGWLMEGEIVAIKQGTRWGKVRNYYVINYGGKKSAKVWDERCMYNLQSLIEQMDGG